jgi:hypothetical protein
MRQSARISWRSTKRSQEKVSQVAEPARKTEAPMKKRLFVMTSLLVLSILAASRVARAQENMVVNVPFAFVAGQAALPAGEYRINISFGSPSLLLTPVDNPGASAIVVTMPTQANEPSSDSKLVFHRYGNRYFLSECWRAGSSSGRQLRKSEREKEIALAASIKTPEQVTLTARLNPPQR